MLASIVRWFVLLFGVPVGLDCFLIEILFSIVNHLLVFGIFCRNELCCGMVWNFIYL